MECLPFHFSLITLSSDGARIRVRSCLDDYFFPFPQPAGFLSFFVPFPPQCLSFCRGGVSWNWGLRFVYLVCERDDGDAAVLILVVRYGRAYISHEKKDEDELGRLMYNT